MEDECIEKRTFNDLVLFFQVLVLRFKFNIFIDDFFNSLLITIGVQEFIEPSDLLLHLLPIDSLGGLIRRS